MASTPEQFAAPMGPAGSIGVFDSGVGGLSVLRHIRELLPNEDLLYFADSGYAPYGERSEDDIAARSLAIAAFLIQQGACAIVVACNTATAAAIRVLRERYPALPIVGVEPGLKPAAAASKTGVVGVLATRATLASDRFAALREQIASTTGVQFHVQACVGLADQIEKGELHSAETAAILHRHVQPLIAQNADTLVLGCTHYPFIQPLLESVVATYTRHPVNIIDTGVPVARQLHRLLAMSADEREGKIDAIDATERRQSTGRIAGFTTGSASSLDTAFVRLLDWEVPVTQMKTC